MGIKKYKYYFKKPKSEIVKEILIWLVFAGAICITVNSPYFVKNLLNNYKKWKKYSRKKIGDTFYNLKRQGLIEIKRERNQIYISLTKDGKRKAGIFQINNFKIKRSKKWNKKWSVVIFDIAQLKKFYREAFRGKLKELGFYPLQKSIWVHPFNCQTEIELLRDFFGLSENEVRLIIAEDIGDDKKLKNFFKLI